ncbi:MAG: DUF433 domain-containing protein [Acidobacteriia bacterium]|nr:DUF433 domain-containing protein [Terriglobia bacterium]
MGKEGGKPCIRGLRFTVYDLASYLASGMTEEEILKDFPYLKKEDFRAVYEFFARIPERIGAAVMAHRVRDLMGTAILVHTRRPTIIRIGAWIWCSDRAWVVWPRILRLPRGLSAVVRVNPLGKAFHPARVTHTNSETD